MLPLDETRLEEGEYGSMFGALRVGGALESLEHAVAGFEGRVNESGGGVVEVTAEGTAD